MPGRIVGRVLMDIMSRMPELAGERPTLDSLPEVMGRHKEFWEAWRPELNEILKERTDNLTVSKFRMAAAAIRSAIGKWSKKDPARKHAQRFATLEYVVLALLDSGTANRMARMDPEPVPTGRPAEPDLYRSGHPSYSPHHEVEIGTRLFGSRLVSYFYVSGQEFPTNDWKDTLKYLVAHDSDEFVLFLGNCEPPTQWDGSKTRARARSMRDCVGSLPIYLEGSPEVFERVRRPIDFRRGNWLLYDGRCPHYWFATPGSVAFYVTASASGMFRKPVAWRARRGDRVPGGSYPFCSDQNGTNDGNQAGTELEFPPDDRMSYLLGKRLRRSRSSYGISARDVEELKTSGRLTTNIIGKIENNTLGTLYVRTLEDVAQALDLPLSELLDADAWLYDQPLGAEFLPENNEEVVSLERGMRHPHGRGFAISPFLLKLGPFSETRSRQLEFSVGDADVTVLVLSGSLFVDIALDPLLVSMEVQYEKERDLLKNVSDSKNVGYRSWRLPIPDTLIEDLQRKNLLRVDEIKAMNAYQFNTAFPHRMRPGREGVTAVVVTTRNDAGLPEEWFKSRTKQTPPRSRRA